MLKTVLRISLVIAGTFILQIILIGEVVQTNQFLFVPVCCYWIAVAFLIPKSFNKRLNLQSLIAVGMLALILVFSVLVKQNFRDPFDIKLPQVGSGRYEENELWRPALKIAREKCGTISPDEIIIITQKTDIWFDAPVVVKCKFIAK